MPPKIIAGKRRSSPSFRAENCQLVQRRVCSLSPHTAASAWPAFFTRRRAAHKRCRESCEYLDDYHGCPPKKPQLGWSVVAPSGPSAPRASPKVSPVMESPFCRQNELHLMRSTWLQLDIKYWKPSIARYSTHPKPLRPLSTPRQYIFPALTSIEVDFLITKSKLRGNHWGGIVRHITEQGTMLRFSLSRAEDPIPGLVWELGYVSAIMATCRRQCYLTVFL